MGCTLAFRNCDFLCGSLDLWDWEVFIYSSCVVYAGSLKRFNSLSKLWESISIGLPPWDKMALTSFNLFAFPVTNAILEFYNCQRNKWSSIIVLHTKRFWNRHHESKLESGGDCYLNLKDPLWQDGRSKKEPRRVICKTPIPWLRRCFKPKSRGQWVWHLLLFYHAVNLRSNSKKKTPLLPPFDRRKV